MGNKNTTRNMETKKIIPSNSRELKGGSWSGNKVDFDGI